MGADLLITTLPPEPPTMGAGTAPEPAGICTGCANVGTGAGIMGICLGARGLAFVLTGIVGKGTGAAQIGIVGAGAVCAGKIDTGWTGCTACGIVGIHAGMVGAGTKGATGWVGRGAAVPGLLKGAGALAGQFEPVHENEAPGAVSKPCGKIKRFPPWHESGAPVHSITAAREPTL